VVTSACTFIPWGLLIKKTSMHNFALSPFHPYLFPTILYTAKNSQNYISQKNTLVCCEFGFNCNLFYVYSTVSFLRITTAYHSQKYNCFIILTQVNSTCLGDMEYSICFLPNSSRTKDFFLVFVTLAEMLV
jgi:hypothetical protein